MVSGIDALTLEGFDVWCLEDGTHVFDAHTFPGLGFDEQQTRLETAGLTEIETVFNTYLIRDAQGVHTLVDAGCGTAFGEKAGKLLRRMAEMGVQPAQIDRLVFTHLHTDHCGGALADGAQVFANATIYLHEAEAAYWAQTEHLAAKVLSSYAARVTHVADGDEFAPGMSAWHLPGHTPGHMGVRIGQDLILLADILHSEALQIGEPRLSSENDIDAWQAAETRLMALREVANTGVIFSGSHLMGPSKFTRLVEIGDGFIRVSL